MNTFEQYKTAAELIYPGLGAWTYDTFARLNEIYFQNEIAIIPIQWHLTLPHGHNTGLACAGALIKLGLYQNKDINLKDGKPCLYGEHVILHEMLHIYLQNRGEKAEHNSIPWCREIMRISRQMGLIINASPQRVIKVKNGNGTRCSVRVSSGITRKQLASWPHFMFDYQTEQPLSDYL